MWKTCLLVSFSILPAMAADTVREAETAELQAKASASDYRGKSAAVIQTAEFHLKFNKMLDAMRAFTSDYNDNKGQAWPANRAAALDQAMKDLQKTEMWKQYAAKFPRAPDLAASTQKQ